jgi:hypothetical protein
METIVVCTVFQDAAAFILEWIAFHRLIGVDRFVLYDRGSTDGTAAMIGHSRFARQVTVIDWQGKDTAAAYGHFTTWHARQFTWAAVLSIGEFLHPLQADTLRPLLPRYAGFAAVTLRRLVFSTAGHAMRPGLLLSGTFTDRAADDSPLGEASPTLFHTADLDGMQGSGFLLRRGTCNARGEPLADADRGCDDVLMVNRYRQAVAPPPLVPDRRITRFVPRLRALLHDVALAAEPRPLAISPAATSPAPAATSPAATSPAAPAPAQPPPPLLLGIGIVTYNRREVLSATLDHVIRHTRHPRTVLAVADDGSTDGTLEMLRERRILTVTGRNMSIAWNKNRALFLLAELSRCDIVILLEDDAYPAQDGWESEWMQAAIRWGHANIAGRWLQEHFIAGAGTVDDPIYSQRITAQCAVFSREALLFGGYFDTRFREYGHEHVEHTRRLLRLGYGGSEEPVNGHPGPLFKLLRGGIEQHAVASAVAEKEAQAERSLVLAQALFGDASYRGPWRNETEAKQMRDEMRNSFPRPVL